MQSKCALLALVTLLSMLSATGSAAIVSPPIDFNVATDFTDNFVVSEGATPAFDNVNERMQITANNQVSISRYDTSPANMMMDNTDFLDETISLTVRYSALNSSSIGLVTRVQSNNLGVLALLNVNSASEVQLRLFHGAQTFGGSGAGTAFFTQTFSGLSNTVAANSPLSLSLTQLSGADPVFNFTLSDAEGVVATTGDRALTTTESYNGAGAAAIRLFAVSGQTTSLSFDNFSAVPVPEPAGYALACLGLIGVIGLARIRRETVQRLGS